MGLLPHRVDAEPWERGPPVRAGARWRRAAWFPRRDQLTRNLDLVGQAAPGKPGYVLLATEVPVDEPSEDELASAAPHLGERAAAILIERYLGQVTWQDLCEVTGSDFSKLPNEVD